jgi:hypothetical protein
MAAGSWPPWEVWPDLRRLAVLPQAGQVLLRSSHCLDGCRKDRHSPGDPRFLRRDGKEGVLFEEAGAGAITRIWMTSSLGNGMSVPLDPGVLYSYFPMPFEHSARLVLDNRGDQAMSVAFGVRRHPDGPLPGSGRFAAQLRDPRAIGGPEDLPLLALDRPGKWVGLFAELGSVDVVESLYLEGDDRLYLDGALHPASYGTGTEDLFDAGFYFDQGAFGRALHGLQWRGERLGPLALEEVSSTYRLMLTDAVPAAASLRAGLERGPEGGEPMRARTVAYHYLGDGETLEAVDVLDLSDTASVAAHGYQPDGGAKSYELDALFEGEPPLPLSATGIRRPAGSSASFTMVAAGCLDGWRLRRRFDSQHGGQTGEVWVDGRLAASWPYALANPDRRWREVDVELPAPASETLDVAIRSLPVARRKRLFRRRQITDFTEFRYELWCRVDRRIFADGFESGDTSGWSEVGAAVPGEATAAAAPLASLTRGPL